jgi:hypothetical protein
MAERGKIWEVLGKSVKWEEVVRHAPKIVEAARILYETNRQRQPRPAGSGGSAGPEPTSDLKTSLADLEAQVSSLQDNESQQAALVSDIARQLNALTSSVDALGSRMQMLLWLAAGGLVAGLAALVLALVR